VGDGFADGETITVPVQEARQMVLTPDGAEWTPRSRVDNAMVKALARAGAETAALQFAGGFAAGVVGAAPISAAQRVSCNISSGVAACAGENDPGEAAAPKGGAEHAPDETIAY
jgi:hypothetical protein